MTTSNARQLAEASARVSSWASLTPQQRRDLLAAGNVRRFDSGGAMASVAGVDRFFASQPDALDELAANARPNA